MIDTISEPYKVDGLVQSFEEQLELFFSKDFETIPKKPEKSENLGQVFTSPILAKFMISLLKENISSESKILDPCIGPNTFFKALPKEVSNCYLKGVEIDENLINEEIKNFYNEAKRTLIQGSFLI
jgi:type I restriction-modification system DNA methylase subunit